MRTKCITPTRWNKNWNMFILGYITEQPPHRVRMLSRRSKMQIAQSREISKSACLKAVEFNGVRLGRPTKMYSSLDTAMLSTILG